jgi:hypothetical protein
MFQRPNTFGEAAFYPYKINQSCRFNDDDSAYLTWTPGVDADNDYKSTWSFWVKRCNLGILTLLLCGYASAGTNTSIYFDVNDKLKFHQEDATAVDEVISNQVFRDVGSWYHIVIHNDYKNGTAANRVKVWVNGELITWVGADYPGTTDILRWLRNGVSTSIGRTPEGGTTADCYISELHAIDGLLIPATDFGKFKNGIWIPKEYTSSYGTNGFYLDFADSADLGNDVSGNNNDFTSSGLTSDDQVLDSPTNNYATLNNIDPLALGVAAEGNLQKQTTGASVVPTNFVMSTMMIPKTGKWYCEVIYVANYSSRACYGVCNSFRDKYDFIFASNGNHYNESTNVAYGNTWTVEQIGIAVDMDNETLTLYISNVSQGVIDISGRYGDEDLFFAFGDGSGSYYITFLANFGQLGFTYTPPTGYKALCSNNLPTLSIKDSSTGFDVVLYEGNSTERNIIDLSFPPDLIWTKNRDTAYFHVIQDSVRGFTTDKKISSSEAYAENHANLDDQYGYISAVSSTGYTISKDGTGSQDWGQMNISSENYVAWCFRMGSKYGFDIQSYTGTGVAHAENRNLGGTPELMDVKNLDSAYQWLVYHHHAGNKTDPETDYGSLNNTAAWADLATPWNDTAPTSTQFTVGTSVASNENTKNHVAYLWRSIEGFSKVFSYTGNANVDGPFVYCGFRPAFVLYKNAHAAYDWGIFDTERSVYNVVNKRLIPNTYGVEDTIAGIEMDILSNGFKIRGTHANINGSGNVLVGIAISEQSSKWSNSR